MPDNHDTATVERFIAAPPEKIFDLLADPARHQEIDGSGTVRGTLEGSQRLVLGSEFGMAMKAGIGYRMANTVVEFDENRIIAWQTRPAQAFMRRLVGGRIWRYELVPQDNGTLLRETWDIRREVLPWTIRPLRKSTVESMTKTLERIDQVVTS